MNAPWIVYVLRCRDGSLYCGATNDLPARLVKHSTGRGSKYVASRLPAMIVWQKEFPSAPDALRAEAAIKRLPKASKEQLVTGQPQIAFRLNQILCTQRRAKRKKDEPPLPFEE
jgi:putative endonuclease